MAEATKISPQSEKDILGALKKAGEQMTPEQKRQQRISFVMGTLDSESNITRDFVEAVLEKAHGT